MAFLERENGRRVYFEDNGSGDTAIVMIHGWGTSVRVWDYSLPALLNAGFRVVTLDHRGCGQSDKDFSDMGITAIASDVVALVQSLGLKRVALNGWSLGGAVAVEAAASLGASCFALVLTCGAAPAYLQKPDYPYGGTDEAMAGTLEAMAGDRVNFLRAMTEGVFASPPSEAMLQWMWQIFMDASPLAAQALADLGPLDQRATLSGLAMPVLSIVGGKDVVVDPAIGRTVGDYHDNTRVVEFADSGHAPFLEESAAYHAALIEFLNEQI